MSSYAQKRALDLSPLDSVTHIMKKRLALCDGAHRCPGHEAAMEEQARVSCSNCHIYIAII